MAKILTQFVKSHNQNQSYTQTTYSSSQFFFSIAAALSLILNSHFFFKIDFKHG